MAKKKTVRRKRSRSPKKAKRRVTIIRRTVIKRTGSARRKGSTISRAKRTIQKAADKMLKDALFERDKATNYKQHRRAQLKVDKARRELRRVQ